MIESKGLVLIDSSALEERYLGPMFRGERCRDIASIIEHGYQPAVLQKTLAEVWTHAKLGTGNASAWARQCADYPGSLDRMVAAIGQADSQADCRQTAWLWFNLAEEWGEHASSLDTVRVEFLHWKQVIERFCLRVETELESAGVAIVSSWHTTTTPRARLNAAVLERETALHSLLPSEDAAWMLEALLVEARAIVTCDKGLMQQGRLSLGFNLGAPTVLHPASLSDALSDEFGFAIYAMAG